MIRYFITIQQIYPKKGEGADTFEILWCKQTLVQKVGKAGPMANKKQTTKCVNVQSNERKPIIEKCQCSVHTQ